MLEAPDQLALDHRQHRQDAEDDREDDDRLDDHDPGRFDELGVAEGEHQARASLSFSIVTWTGPPLSRLLALPSRTPSAMKTTPVGTRSLIWTWALTAEPFWLTRTWSPDFRPRRSASAVEISTRWTGVRNFNGGLSSVIGPAQRSR